MNVQELRECTELPAPLVPFNPEHPNHGFFGFDGVCADRAISQDAPKALKWLIDQGLISDKFAPLGSTSLLNHCRRRGSVKCADMLQKIGFIER
jgi:hypothetical protein